MWRVFFKVFTHTRNRHFRKSGAIFIFFGVLQTGWMTVQTFFCRLLMKLDYVHRILKCKWCCGDSFPLPAAILCEDDRETSRCRTNLKYSTHLYFKMPFTLSAFFVLFPMRVVDFKLFFKNLFWQEFRHFGGFCNIFSEITIWFKYWDL